MIAVAANGACEKLRRLRGPEPVSTKQLRRLQGNEELAGGNVSKSTTFQHGFLCHKD